MNINISARQLKQRIDDYFIRYDKDHSDTLDSKQIIPLFNELLQTSKSKRRVTQQQAKQLIQQGDYNRDMKLNKQELFNLFKNILGLINSV